MPLIFYVEMFYLNSILNLGILPVLVFQLEVCYKVDRLLTGLTAQQKGTTAQWYSNKTSLIDYFFELFPKGVNFLKETLYCLFINTFKHEYKCPLGLTYFQ